MKADNKPLVSIIIPVYNGEDYLAQAVKSALAQSYANIEVVIVDDGSIDATPEVIKGFGKRVRYIKKKNGGVASALNRGIKEARGEYVSWLSHDDVYYRDKIDAQIKFISSLEKPVDIVYSDVEYIDENSKTLSITNYGRDHLLKNLNHGLYPVLKGLVNGCALLIRKSCFSKVGYFDEKLKTSNDYDMWFRAFKICRTRYIPKVLIKYRLHSKQGTKTSTVYLEESNNLWVNFLKKLTSEDILYFEPSLFSFYFKIAEQMRLSGYDKAYEYAWGLAKTEYSKTIPEVTVIMPCFNSGKFIYEAINSILNQSFKSIEVLIIDDASTDNTKELINSFKEKDFRIKAIYNETNTGIPNCMNSGLKQAVGKYITRMDADDISLPQRIEKQVALLDSHKEFGICSVDISTINEEGAAIVGSLYPETCVPLTWLFLWKNPIANAPAMFRGEIIVGKFFNKDLKIAEDYDFLSRVILDSNVHQINEVLYKYRIHEQSSFQNHIKEACLNSITISRALAASLTNETPPVLHDQLTEFAKLATNGINDKGIIELSLWMSRLLMAGRKRWKWSDTEFDLARSDADKRILDYISRNQNNKPSQSHNLTSNDTKIDITGVKRKLKDFIKKALRKMLMYTPNYRKLIQLEDWVNNNTVKLDSITERFLKFNTERTSQLEVISKQLDDQLSENQKLKTFISDSGPHKYDLYENVLGEQIKISEGNVSKTIEYTVGLAEYFQQLRKYILKTEIVLDIGCGVRPQTFFEPRVHICIEPFKEYIDVVRPYFPNHYSSFVFMHSDALSGIKIMDDDSVDSIFLLDVIEHLEKKAGHELLKEADRVARKQIFIYTPLGFYPQHYDEKRTYDKWGLTGAKYQEHKSGWLPADFGKGWDFHICINAHEADDPQEIEKGIKYSALVAIKTKKFTGFKKQINTPDFIKN